LLFHTSVLINTYKEIFGVDIRKDVFDVYESKSGRNQFKNDEFSFKNFAKMLLKNSLVVMEATCYFHYILTQFLYKKGVVVSSVNPL
jgi:transposase